MKPILLSSTSPTRKRLLDKLKLPYECFSPNIDETPLGNENAEQLVERLALAKAQKGMDNYPNHLIIGSDEVGCIDGIIFSKPLNFENAFQQLKACSGKTIDFYTGLCLINSESKRIQHCVERYRVHFRELSDETITQYLKIDQPFQCAGSIKAEGIAVSLFKRFEGDDYSALLGLPLMRLVEFLNNEGVNPLEIAATIER